MIHFALVDDEVKIMDNETATKLKNAEFDALTERILRTHRQERAQTPPAYFEALGRIVVKFASLEFTINRHIILMIGAEGQIGRVVTSEASFRNLVATLNGLHKYLEGDSADMDVLLKAIYNANDVRNSLLHSVWIGNGDPTWLRHKESVRRKGLQVSDEHYSVDDLNEIADWIGRIDNSVDGLLLEEYSARSMKKGPVSVEVQGTLVTTTYPGGLVVVSDKPPSDEESA